MYIQLYALYIDTCISSNMDIHLYALYIEERQGVRIPDEGVLRHHLESCTPGLWRYIPVHTGMYRYVRFLCTYRYVLFVNFRMTVHTGTYQYRPSLSTELESLSTYEYVRVRTLLCLSRYMAVHGSTWQYMQKSITVYGSTWRYIAVQSLVYHGLWQYMAVHGRT